MRKTLIKAETKVFPANYLLLLLNFIESEGYKTDEIMSQIQSPKQLTPDPEQFVSHAYLIQFLESILKVTHAPELGLYFGQQLNFTAHGYMGYVIVTSKNLGEALEMILKYYKTRTALADISIETQGGHCVIRAGFNLLPDAIEQFLIDAFFASVLTIGKFIRSEKHHDIQVYLKKAKPKNTKPYSTFFGKEVHFSATHNKYRFPKESLALTFPLSNPIARIAAERKCQEKMQELEHLDDLVSKVKSLLLAVPSYFPNIDELSQKLHMSTRTLRRKLQELDSSYQEILDELRKELAINYLQNSQLSILEIAHMLQFSDSSNFSSAFRKWTNKSPSDFRSF